MLCSARVDPFLSLLSVPPFVCSVVRPSNTHTHTHTRCESIDRSVHIHPYTQAARDTDREVTSSTKRVHETSRTASNRVSTYTRSHEHIYEHSRRNVRLPVSPPSPLPPSPSYLIQCGNQCIQWWTDATHVRKRALVMLCLRARICVCVHRTSTNVHSHTHTSIDTRAAPLREPPKCRHGRQRDRPKRARELHTQS